MKCEIGDCRVEPTFHVSRIESRRVLHKEYLCDEHAEAFLAEFRATRTVGPGTDCSLPGLVPVDLEAIIYRNGPEEKPVCVYLHEIGGTRRFGTMIDVCAWSALVARLENYAAPRPPTHGGWAATIRELGGRLQDVVVDRPPQADGWLDARLRIVMDRRVVGVPVRASDAYVIALVAGVPMLAVEEALDAFAVTA